jgi:hypothetical protein
MKDYSGFACCVYQCFCQYINGKLCVDTSAVYTGNDTAIEQIDDVAVVSLAVIGVLAMLPVVVVPVWINPKMLQQSVGFVCGSEHSFLAKTI